MNNISIIPMDPSRGFNLPEIVWATLLVVGFVVSISTIGSAMMYYIVALLSGILLGRLWYKVRDQLKFKYLMMIICFMAGFVAGSIFKKYGHPGIIVVVLLCGTLLGNYLTAKGYMDGIDI